MRRVQIFYSFLNQQIAEKTVIVLTHDPAIKGADDIIDLDKAKSATR